CLEVGMNDHISKPIDPVLLFETVGRYYKPKVHAEAIEAGEHTRPRVSRPAPSAVGSTGPDVNGASGVPNVTREAPATAPEAGALPIPAIEGLDTKDGLSRIAGNRKLYSKLLRQFIEQQGPALEQITVALAQGDTVLAERLAHTLKGVAGNIGAKSVQESAGTLEKLIRSRAEPAAVEAVKQAVSGGLEPLLAGFRGSGPSAEAAALRSPP